MSALHEELNPEGAKPPEWLRDAHNVGAVATVHSITPEVHEASPYNSRLARAALVRFLELDENNEQHSSRLNSLSRMEDEDVAERIDVLLGRWQDSIPQQEKHQASEAASEVFKDSLRGMSVSAIQIRHNLAVSSMVQECLDDVTEGVRNILIPGRVQATQDKKLAEKAASNTSQDETADEKKDKKVVDPGTLIPDAEALSAPLGLAITTFGQARKLNLARQNALVYHLDEYAPDNHTNGDVEEALRTFATAAQTLLDGDPQAFTPLEVEAIGRLTGKDLRTLRDPKMQLVLKQRIRSAAHDMEQRLDAEHSTMSEVLERVFHKVNQPTSP